MFQNNIFSFDVAELREALQQRPEIWSFLLRATSVPKITYSRNFSGLLRASGAWQPNDRSANKPNELASFHGAIT